MEAVVLNCPSPHMRHSICNLRGASSSGHSKGRVHWVTSATVSWPTSRQSASCQTSSMRCHPFPFWGTNRMRRRVPVVSVNSTICSQRVDGVNGCWVDAALVVVVQRDSSESDSTEVSSLVITLEDASLTPSTRTKGDRNQPRAHPSAGSTPPQGTVLHTPYLDGVIYPRIGVLSLLTTQHQTPR